MPDPQTPPRRDSHLTPDTLAVPKHTSSGAYRKGDLDQKRAVIMNDLGSYIPEVTVEFFLDKAAPKVDGIELMAITQRLIARRHVQDNGWTAFSVQPAKSNLREPDAFQPLGVVFKNIIDCSGLVRSPYLQYHDDPHRAPISTLGNKTRPDGYFTRQSNVEGGHKWSDVAVPGEYKKGKSKDDIDDNVRKIIWNMHHTMRDDPCRRFTFGFTIENTSMRLWFVSRSTVFVTKSFDFMEDRDPLIRFVLSVAYSTPESVGWDPTMRRVPGADQDHFDITVHARISGQIVPIVYRTEGILSDFATDALRGRGTRVFKARMLNRNTDKVEGDPVALKDVWVDHDRDREGETRQKLEDEANEQDKALIRQYFMTILHHGDVLINNQTDHTQDLMLRRFEVPSNDRFLLRKPMGRSETTASTGSIPLVDAPGRSQRRHASHHRYSAKVHYRIVYKEVAEAIHSVKSLATAFQSLMDGTKALELLHKYGWVHRDVSAGNLLVFNGNGKLSDLEYTKKMSQASSHEIRTGTLDFMAVEVEHERYLFVPQTRVSSRKDLASRPRPPLFCYNPLHDLESMWRIALWMIFNHRDVQGEIAHSSVEEQAGYARSLFPGILFHTGRTEVLRAETTLYDALPHLPESFQDTALRLEVIRQELVKNYKVAEAGPEIDQAAFQEIHSLLIREFMETRDDSGQVQLYRLTGTSKRPRSASGAPEQVIEPSGADSPTPSSRPKRLKTSEM